MNENRDVYKVLFSNNEDEEVPFLVKCLFYPYDNLVDWAMSRGTNDGNKERKADSTF